MNNDLPKNKFLISGTMRGGSSLVSNMFNAHSEVMVLGEYIHFFRFIYKHCEPLTKDNIHRMLKEQNARLFHRYSVRIDVDSILADICEYGFNYQSIYDSIMRYYLGVLGKQIAGEDAAMNWTTIPEHLRLFPDAKAIHILRDPRSVLASWHKASYQKVDYLDALFNLFDSLDKASEYSRTLPPERYTTVRYEDILHNPEKEIRRLCDFVGIEFEPIQVQPEKWAGIFDGVYVKRGWSSVTGKAHSGFDVTRLKAWEQNLEEWELCLTEWLLLEKMRPFGYEPTGKTFSPATIRKGLDIMRSSPFLFRQLNRWLSSDQGAEGYPDDPREPVTWGATGKNKTRFLDCESGKAYLEEMHQIAEDFREE